ncbi:flocculation-associated PEP-CTERM protein PepA [Rubrivivax albus]|uniref:Flocculation-associated PEP-CTERM protein PepA n=1 Tax=Rubrivivax albus TaxID=2499835 RepID=A0A3S2VYT9_9BURK|nr:flocculation-associated PEP-CTERM protein PepA [Rubrivivax albus]RVT53435.1 flocculation-associated PEP-CTERM protein PepA [Rubrivivax albus]
MSLSKSLKAIALAVPLLFGASQAFAAGTPFCVDTTGYDPTDGITGNQVACFGEGAQAGETGFEVRNLNGSYVEKFQAFFVGPQLNFAATILADWNSFVGMNGAGINGTGLDNDYNLYAVVQATGFVSGANSFFATGATLSLFMDANQDADLSLAGIDNGTLAFTGAGAGDVLLASSTTLLSGSGTTSASAGSDGFAVLFDDFVLTATGEDFFIAPRPFYIRVYSDGDINDGTVETVAPGLFEIQGDLSAEFRIPEPGTLALAGLALLGAGVARRRKA